MWTEQYTILIFLKPHLMNIIKFLMRAFLEKRAESYTVA